MEKHTPYFTPFADDIMRKETKLCQKAKIYKGSQSPKYQEKLRNARLCNNDKSTIYLPRQYLPQHNGRECFYRHGRQAWRSTTI